MLPAVGLTRSEPLHREERLKNGGVSAMELLTIFGNRPGSYAYGKPKTLDIGKIPSRGSAALAAVDPERSCKKNRREQAWFGVAESLSCEPRAVREGDSAERKDKPRAAPVRSR